MIGIIYSIRSAWALYWEEIIVRIILAVPLFGRWNFQPILSTRFGGNASAIREISLLIQAREQPSLFPEHVHQAISLFLSFNFFSVSFTCSKKCFCTSEISFVSTPRISDIQYLLSPMLVYPNVRKTPSLQGGDISTNLLIFDVFFDDIQRSSPTGCHEITRRPQSSFPVVLFQFGKLLSHEPG